MSDTATIPANPAATLAHLLDDLAALDVDTLTDADRIDLITTLERLKGAAAACQARAVVAFADSQRRADAEQGVRPEKQGAGVPIQVGLAMRVSHAKARRFVGFAHALTEVPHTQATLAAGETSEYRAYLVARETIALTREDRQAVDAELHHRPGGIAGMSDRDAETHTRAIAQRLDPAAAVARHSAAVKQRRVSLRPAPDGMCRLSAVLPLPDGVRVFATLDHAAKTARAAGHDRSRGAVMAEELTRRVTTSTAPLIGGPRDGRCATSSTTPTTPDLVVNLVMTDAALLGSDDPHAHQEPAQVVTDTGIAGHLPADTARSLVRDAARVWVRRLYRDPGTGDLVAMDSRSRVFDGHLRRFLVLRDQQCRTPWCDAPVRHADHVTRWTHGGETAATNGQGLCAACNHAKEHADLHQQARLDGSITTHTPTGHTYRSHRPRPPGPPPPTRVDWTVLEAWTRERLPA